MRYYMIFFAAMLTTIAFSSCLNKDGFMHFSFDVDHNASEQTLPGDPAGAMLPPQELPDIPMDIELGSDENFNSQAFDHLVAIELKGLVFTITASSTDPAVDLKEPGPTTPDDWSFFQSAEIYIENPTTSQQALIAYVPLDDPQLQPGAGTTLAFACLDVNLLDYFDGAHNTKLVVRAVGTCPPDDVIFQVSVNFKVTAALIK